MPYQSVAFLAALAVLIVSTRVVVGSGRSATATHRYDNPRREARLALIPTLLLFALTGAMFLGVASRERRPTAAADAGAQAFTAMDAAGQLAANAIAIAPFVLMMVSRRQGLATIGLSSHNVGRALFIGVAASAVTAVIYNKTSGLFWLNGDTLWRLVAQMGVGASEEAIFRGYLQLRLAAWADRYGWIAAALICSHWHVPAALAAGGAGASVLVGILAKVFAAALAFGYCMKLTGNIAGLSLFHAILNVVSD